MMKKMWIGLALLGATGCGGFQLSPVTPANGPGSVKASMPISNVTVKISPSMEQDQQQVLNRHGVPAEIQRVLGISLGAGQPGGASVQVLLTSIRHSSFGPSRMHSTTTVVGPDGAVMKTFEAESVSMRSKALARVAQDHVQRLADGV